MEEALRYELNKIPEINNKIFPTNAPKGKKAPYLVYVSRTKPLKDLDGINNDRESHVLLNILCASYEEMRVITEKVEELVETFLSRSIGVDGPYIEDLIVDDIAETYENELELYRGIIPFQIFYKELK